MTNHQLPLLPSEILALWSLSCRAVRQIIIQYQISGHDCYRRAALSALSGLERLKREILPLLRDRGQQEKVEWDHVTVLHLHSLISHKKDRTEDRSDQFSQVVKLAKTMEIEKILSRISQ